MNTRHKHADLIIAWANGAKIQYYHCGDWFDVDTPNWRADGAYRIKPKAKVKKYRYAVSCGAAHLGAEITTKYYESYLQVPGRHAFRLDWTMIEVEEE
jgi:hypothetical protein